MQGRWRETERLRGTFHRHALEHAFSFAAAAVAYSARGFIAADCRDKSFEYPERRIYAGLSSYCRHHGTSLFRAALTRGKQIAFPFAQPVSRYIGSINSQHFDWLC